MTEERKKEIEKIIYSFDEITQNEMRAIPINLLDNLLATSNNQLLDAMQIMRERS